MWLRHRRPRYDCWVYFGSVPELISELPDISSHCDGRSSRWQARLCKYISHLCNITSADILLAKASRMANPVKGQ
ncbi:protein kish-A isoform X4 [Pan troglodytes]|uniref:protein kish-A isoform X4 n=1 Tax=Pan troglodytes TaxID=9598 RepID=UPI0007DBB0D6